MTGMATESQSVSTGVTNEDEIAETLRRYVELAREIVLGLRSGATLTADDAGSTISEGKVDPGTLTTTG